MSTYYAAYGSNLDVKQMNQICKREIPLVGKGFIQDHELEFRIFANIKKKVGSKVPVVVWLIEDGDEFYLDQFEGVFSRDYRKSKLTVHLDDGSQIEALVYLLARKMSKNPPSDSYYEVIEDGYIQHDLPLSYLAESVSEYRDKIV